jgi:hypothetical protein
LLVGCDCENMRNGRNVSGALDRRTMRHIPSTWSEEVTRTSLSQIARTQKTAIGINAPILEYCSRSIQLPAISGSVDQIQT